VAYVEQCLAPMLKCNDYLPQCSPDLNPIEMSFSKFRNQRGAATPDTCSFAARVWPATSFADAPAASRISRTPRTSPIAGLAGVLATLLTRMVPALPSTATISVKVPLVSMPMRKRGSWGAGDMPRSLRSGAIDLVVAEIG
jgi:hypothetical protein